MTNEAGLGEGKGKERGGKLETVGGGLSYLKKHGLGGHLFGPGAGRRGPYPSFRGLNPKHKNPPNPPPPSGCQRVSEVQIESRSPCLFLCVLWRNLRPESTNQSGLSWLALLLLVALEVTSAAARLSLYDDDDTLFAVARGGHNTNTKQAGSQEIQYM